MNLAEIVDYLKDLDLFRGVPDEDLADIAAIARIVEFDEGQFICRQGEEGQDLFAIIAGSVSIQQGSRVLAKVDTGEVVGELAFLDQQPRSADVVAAEPLRLLEIRGHDFQPLIEQHGTLARKLLQVLAARIRRTSSRQERVDQLVRAYRERGHVLADLDPSIQALVSEIELRKARDIVFHTTILDNRGSIEVRMGRRDIREQLVKLHAFWHQALLPDPALDVRQIDLRFDSQIVTR